MTKKYKSYTQVAFSVTLPGGGSKRISFSPRTGNGSVFFTDDVRVQKAIESHPNFGKSFFLDRTEESAPVKKTILPSRPDTASANVEVVSPAAAPAPENADKEVPFTNLSDAKEYLARHFDIPRTQLRSKDAIKKYAAMNNVIFVGIDD